MGAVYTTRERIMRAADVKATAYLSAEIDQAMEAGARAIDRLCHRGDEVRPGFAPWKGSITYDWPTLNNDSSYRFWLNQNSLLSLTTAVSGGVTITSDCLLRPETGPPYSWLAVDRGSNSLLKFTSGAGEESLVLTGLWGGARNVEKISTSWTLSGSVNSSVTTMTLNAPLGVGNLIRLDDERLIITEKTWADSGQTTSATASLTAQTLAVSDGTDFFLGEELLIDAERVLIREIAGNNLIVQRAVGGSTLAAHTSAAVYWARSFTVERGALGTTAASHTDAAQIYVWQPPALVEQLNVAYALDQRAQESSAYARTVGTGDSERQASGSAIRALEDRVYTAYGRKFRHRAV